MENEVNEVTNEVTNYDTSDLNLDLGGLSARQYASLILKEDLGYSYARAGRRLGLNGTAFCSLYKRTKQKLYRNHYNNYVTIPETV